jgi:hypothetical protein
MNKNLFWAFLEVETWTFCQHPMTCNWSGGMVKIWTPAKHILRKNLGEVHISNFGVVSMLLENNTNHSLAPTRCVGELKSSFQHINYLLPNVMFIFFHLVGILDLGSALELVKLSIPKVTNCLKTISMQLFNPSNQTLKFLTPKTHWPSNVQILDGLDL